METCESQPHPVPVVRLIVPNAEGKALILRRQNGTYARGKWCLPGGKVDWGETVEEAAAKELREETALRLESARFLFYQDSLPGEGGAMHCVNLYFECAVSGTIVLDEESSEIAWVGPADLGNYEIVFGNDLGLARFWREKNRS